MQYKIGEKVFGDWIIVREIGQGAFGTVYEIHKLDIDYGVPAKSALKVIRIPRNESDVKAILNEGMDEQSVTAYFQGFVDEIIKEISIMSSLKGHSNIVSYEDHCVIRFDEGIGWEILIRMELLSPLQDYVRNHVMDERETIRLGIDICSALVHCQKKGMIHRDIKPENIFVNESGQFKLGDFGIARTLEKTTGGLSKKGTEGYMAPEVYKGRHYGANVDVYSLGLVLYKFMNGNRLPFLPSAPQPIKYSDREQALEKRMSGEELSFPEYASIGFARIILKACSFQREMRYRTAEEMLEELQELYDSTSLDMENISEKEKSKRLDESQEDWESTIKDESIQTPDRKKQLKYPAKRFFIMKFRGRDAVSNVIVNGMALLCVVSFFVKPVIFPLSGILETVFAILHMTWCVFSGLAFIRYHFLHTCTKKMICVEIIFFILQLVALIMIVILTYYNLYVADGLAGGYKSGEKVTNNAEVSETVDSCEERIDLSFYMGENLENVSEQFPDMRSGVSMGSLYYLNGKVSFSSTRTDHAITCLSLNGKDSEYDIQGIYTDMDMAEAGEQLKKRGFWETDRGGIYRNEQGQFMDLRRLEDEEYPRIILRALYITENTGRTELAYYYGASFETVYNDFPELAFSVTDDQAFLGNKFISFVGDYKSGEDIYSVTVKSISITGMEAPYCIYGLYPGGDASLAGESGLEEGGSGEWVDPMGNVVYLYDRDENGTQRIRFYSPS